MSTIEWNNDSSTRLSKGSRFAWHNPLLVVSWLSTHSYVYSFAFDSFAATKPPQRQSARGTGGCPALVSQQHPGWVDCSRHRLWFENISVLSHLFSLRRCARSNGSGSWTATRSENFGFDRNGLESSDSHWGAPLIQQRRQRSRQFTPAWRSEVTSTIQRRLSHSFKVVVFLSRCCIV